MVGWSDPEAMMRACGRSHFSSSTQAPPVVCVNTTSALRTASSAVAQAVKGYPSSAVILSQNMEDLAMVGENAKPVSKPWCSGAY